MGSHSESGGATATGPERAEIAEVLDLVLQEAREYLDGLDGLPVLAPGSETALQSFHTSLPERGSGAAVALRELLSDGLTAAAASAGGRCFHFVMGGSTPAAMGADMFASVIDQLAYTWVASPLAVELELVVLAWLRELFGLPASWSGVMTTGATMANFVGLACGRQWCGEQRGVDLAEVGLAGQPAIEVFASDHIHGSAVKCLSMLGIGRASLTRHVRDDIGNLDLDALERSLRGMDGAPAILVATVGEPNAGASDPVDAMADLAQQYGAWLHVDGAFGLFARVSPRIEHLAAGVERANSVIVDGHKWLNVPYDCGFAFVDDLGLQARAFRYTGAYLPAPDDPRPTPGALGPESSRRARSLAAWATLRAYGRDGVRTMVEGHLDLANQLADLVGAADDLELLAPVPLSVVCFRFNPGGLDDEALDAVNRRLGEALIDDGRFYAGTTTYAGRVALRPAIVNWRTRAEDISAFVEVVRELGRAALDDA